MLHRKLLRLNLSLHRNHQLISQLRSFLQPLNVIRLEQVSDSTHNNVANYRILNFDSDYNTHSAAGSMSKFLLHFKHANGEY
jgi:hypothetical protein